MCSKNTRPHGSRLSGLRMSTGDVQVCHQSPMGSHCTLGVINLGVAVHTAVKVTINHTGGFWHSKFIALYLQNHNWYLSQTSYCQTAHQRNILNKNPTHSNQQLDTLREHFCAKLLSNYKEFEPEFFSCTTTRYLLGRHLILKILALWVYFYTDSLMVNFKQAESRLKRLLQL